MGNYWLWLDWLDQNPRWGEYLDEDELKKPENMVEIDNFKIVKLERSPERRVFYVDVGDKSPKEAEELWNEVN